MKAQRTFFSMNVFLWIGNFSLILCCLLAVESAQAQAFYRKIQVVQVDMGVGGYYKQVKKTKNDDMLGRQLSSMKYRSNSYGLHYEGGAYEWRKKGSLGLGGYIGMRNIYARVPNDTFPDIRFREIWFRYYQVAFESKYHFFTKTRWDPYINGMIGIQFREYRKISINNNLPTVDPQTSNSKVVLLAQFSAGARYYVYNNIAVFWRGRIRSVLLQDWFECNYCSITFFAKKKLQKWSFFFRL